MKKPVLIALCCFAITTGLFAQGARTEITTPFNGFRHVITYDAHNNQTSDTEQEFLNNHWQSIGINRTTYDDRNNILSSLSQYGWQCFYTYDKRNNRTSMVRQYKQDTGYVNVERYYYTYDTNNKKTSERQQEWKGQQWVNMTQIFYSHEMKLSEMWDGKEWVNSTKDTFTYDDRGNTICQLEQYWDGKQWVNSQRWLYTFDLDNKQGSYTNEVWRNNNWGPWEPIADPPGR